MPGIPTSAPPQRHWLITSPRSASNMFVKILNLDEQNVRPSYQGGYFFLDSTIYRNQVVHKPIDEWTAREMKTVLEKQQKSFDNLQDHIDVSESEGKKVFVKEHAYTVTDPINENRKNFPDETEPPTMIIARQLPQQTRSEHNKTVLPDEFLQTWMPTFLIRHPGMIFPSLLRLLRAHTAGGKDADSFGGELTLSWQRHLYDFYSEHFDAQSTNGDADGVRWPILLDADDLMTRPDVIVKYAKLVGLDPEKLRFEWDSISPEAKKALDPHTAAFLGTINDSKGIRTDKVAGNLDISQEAIKWKSEFGDKLGGDLEQWVRDAMPDYEFLTARRLRPE